VLPAWDCDAMRSEGEGKWLSLDEGTYRCLKWTRDPTVDGRERVDGAAPSTDAFGLVSAAVHDALAVGVRIVTGKLKSRPVGKGEKRYDSNKYFLQKNHH
jgi:hypothetical protein